MAKQIEAVSFPVEHGHADYIKIVMEIARRAQQGWTLEGFVLEFSRPVLALRTPDAPRVEVHSGKPK